MTIKAVRAQIKLGNIDLDVLQKPDGSYAMNQFQVTEAVQKDKRSMRDFLASESPFALPYKALSGGKSKGTLLPKISVEGTSQNVTEVGLDLAFAFWLKESVAGNAIATSLVFACGVEALERRADAAFGVKRSEEERNARLEARVKGKLARRNLTDCIRDYIESHDVSDNYKKFIYSNCSDYLNKIILGCKAKQAREFYQLPEDSLLRNHIPASALTELEVAERVAGRAIDDRNMEPLEAVKYACGVAFTRTIGL